MGVEFRLLGAVDALVDGRPVDLGHARQRCVLAALLIDVNRAVSGDQLIDRVWADRPPYRARNALSAYLSRLRQRLDGADVRITRGPAGYALSADPLSIDLHRFRHLVGRARAAGSAAEVSDYYDQALQLWHGAPFGTVDTPWFDAVRTAIEAEHGAVVLDRNDAALATGRHGELLAELTTAARTQPLDERLASQLMLAQYRSGRQADALDTFQQIRGRLLEELGADPGTTLRGVHQQILAGDADGPAPRPGGSAPDRRERPVHPEPSPSEQPSDQPSDQVTAAAPGGNLPRRATSFVGREVDLAQVRTALRDHPLVTLTGVGGVGKTRLAVEAAGQDRSRFADGGWLCELAPLGDGAAVSQALAAALRVRQRQDLTIEQTVIEYLTGRELLLVVDNCEHVLDDVARLLDQLVAHCPGVVVLATSREALGVHGELILPVAPLPAADGMALFAARARAGRPDLHLDDEETDAVAEICRRLDGLPLAIELAAARTRVMNAAEVARRLDDGRLLSRGSRSAQAHHQSLDATVEWSYRLLSDDEKALFTRLSVFSGGFNLDAAHGVCGDAGSAEDDTLDLLSGLVDKSMVTVLSGPGASRYRLLETLRAYGRERLRHTDPDSAFARGHARYYDRFTQQLARGLHGRDEPAWVDRALLDYDNLRTAFERAVAERDGDLALRLATSVSELVHLRVGYESADWALRALDLATDDHPLRAAALGVAARAAWNRGELAAAVTLAERAAGIVPGRGTDRVAYPADVLADVAIYRGDAEPALQHYQSEVDRARRDADPIRLVWTLYYVAVCHAVLRAPESGLAAASESVEVAETTGNPTALSMARYALGLVLKKSDPDRALALFDEAAELAASVRNFWWHGIALMEAAATRAVHGEPMAAARELVEVLDHWDRFGDWTQQWLNLRYVVRLLVRIGADDDAVALHHALVAAGKPSPLSVARLARLAGSVGRERFDAAARRGSGLTGAAAVADARSSLRRVRQQKVGVAGAVGGPRPPSIGTAPAVVDMSALVGRREPLAIMHAALADATAGRTRMVLVAGDAGIGKTRLVDELAATSTELDLDAAWGRCHDGGSAPPFWVWTQLLRAVFAARGSGGLPVGADAGVLAPLLPEVIRDGAVATPPPAHARLQLYDAVTRLLLDLAARRPLLLVLEDLHWGDQPSLELLAYVAGHLRTAPLLLVATLRAEAPGDALASTLAALAREPATVRLRLSGLDPTEVGQMITNRTGRPTDDRLAAAVHTRTDGNPFFVTELTRLVHSGDQPDDPSAWPVPEGVRDVLRRRIARLPEQAVTLITIGAVIGRSFDHDILAHISGGLDDDPILAAVDAAVITGLLLEDPRQPGGYRFTHALVRESLYEALSGMRRARLHARVATALCVLRDGDVDALAHHHWQAGPAVAPETALAHIRRAADAAEKALAYERAIEQLQRAITLIPRLVPGPETNARELDLQHRLGVLLVQTRGYARPETTAAFARVRELAAGDDALAGRLAESLWRLGAASAVAADFATATALADEGMQLARVTGDRDQLMSAHYAFGVLAWHHGRMTDADDHLAEAITLADRSDNDAWATVERPVVSARGFRAGVRFLLGDVEGAATLRAEALAIADRLGEPYSTTFGLFHAAYLAVLERDVQATQRWSAAAITLCDEHGYALFGGMSAVFAGWAAAMRGEAGADRIRAAQDVVEATGARMMRHFFLGLRAEAELTEGRPDDARATLAEAYAESETTGECFYLPALHRLSAQLDEVGARPGPGRRTAPPTRSSGSG